MNQQEIQNNIDTVIAGQRAEAALSDIIIDIVNLYREIFHNNPEVINLNKLNPYRYVTLGFAKILDEFEINGDNVNITTIHEDYQQTEYRTIPLKWLLMNQNELIVNINEDINNSIKIYNKKFETIRKAEEEKEREELARLKALYEKE